MDVREIYRLANSEFIISDPNSIANWVPLIDKSNVAEFVAVLFIEQIPMRAQYFMFWIFRKWCDLHLQAWLEIVKEVSVNEAQLQWSLLPFIYQFLNIEIDQVICNSDMFNESFKLRTHNFIDSHPGLLCREFSYIRSLRLFGLSEDDIAHVSLNLQKEGAPPAIKRAVQKIKLDKLNE